MDFIKQNLVVVACLAVVVLFLIGGVVNLMRAGTNAATQDDFGKRVDQAGANAGIALDSLGLVVPVWDSWTDGAGQTQKRLKYVRVAVRGPREKTVLAQLGSLASALKRRDDVAGQVKRWVDRVHTDDALRALGLGEPANTEQFRQAMAEGLTSELLRIMRREEVSASEAVTRLGKSAKIRAETAKLVKWEVPGRDGGDPELQLLLLGFKPELAEGINAKREELAGMRREVIAEQIRRGGHKQTPLTPGVFPVLEASGNLLIFQTDFQTRISKKLPADLVSGAPYTAQQLTEMLTRIGLGGRQDTTLGDFEMGDIFPGATVETERRGGLLPTFVDPGRTTTEELTEQESLQLQRARDPSMQIYLVDPEKAFGVPMWATSLAIRPPDLKNAWFGQMKLWIIEDFVQAIKDTNVETPSVRANVTGNRFSVQESIVKHLKSIRIGSSPIVVMSALGAESDGGMMGPGMAGGVTDSPYVLPPGAQPTGRPIAPSMPGMQGAARGTFTRREPCEFYDVTYAGLRVVVDARQIRRLMVNIDRQRFYTVVGLQVSEVDHKGARERGLWYGKQPMVDLFVVYEVLLFREIFENPAADAKVDLVPKEVKAMLNWKLPKEPN